MLTVILLVLALYFVQLNVSGWLRYLANEDPRARLRVALGSRDDPPAHTPYSGRAHRAAVNLSESLPLFLTLAVILLISEGLSSAASAGATIFLIARVTYFPVYLIGVPYLRTLTWMVGLLGLLMMLGDVLGLAVYE